MAHETDVCLASASTLANAKITRAHELPCTKLIGFTALCHWAIGCLLFTISLYLLPGLCYVSVNSLSSTHQPYFLLLTGCLKMVLCVNEANNVSFVSHSYSFWQNQGVCLLHPAHFFKQDD